MGSFWEEKASGVLRKRWTNAVLMKEGWKEF